MKTNFDRSPLEANADIVAHNLQMMEEDMQILAGNESMGGNAGSLIIEGKPCSCSGLNGYADRETGRILAFGNPQNIPQEIKNKSVGFTFREASNLDLKKMTELRK